MADQQSIQNLSNQAAAAMNARDWLSLLKISEQWRALDPESQDAARNMTFAYFELGDGEKARDSYRMILDANSGSAQHLGIYARFCLAAFDYEGACEALEEAHKVSQPTAETLYALARAKTFLGDLAEAEELAAQAIDANPNYSLGYVQYSTLRGGDVDEAKAAKMLELGADLSIAPEHRASLFFALGDIHHYKEDYEAAMRCYNAGNHVSGEILAAERQLYAPDNFETIRAREGKLYSKAPEAMDFVAGPATPIFVIGMPRSGTTLIESILAAHPDAYGAGELATLPVIHNKALRWSAENSGATLATAPKEMLQEWREEYFASYPGNLDAPYVVDKQPLNFPKRRSSTYGATRWTQAFPFTKTTSPRLGPTQRTKSISRISTANMRASLGSGKAPCGTPSRLFSMKI